MFARARVIVAATAIVVSMGLGVAVAAPAAAQEISTTTSSSSVPAVQAGAATQPASNDRTAQGSAILVNLNDLPIPVFMMMGLGVVFGGIFLVVGTGNRKSSTRRH